MNLKCTECGLANFQDAGSCSRCGGPIVVAKRGIARTVAKRFAILVVVCVAAIGGFYVSLLFSADRLAVAEQQTVAAAIAVLESKGFAEEAFLLRHVAAFRGNDNWLNASVEKENAYAATNFPVEIVTIYPDFFTLPGDDIERAAILLHEAKHLQGKDEHEAYEFVWKNRGQLGWTAEKYRDSEVWQSVRRQTREYLPSMFICDFNDFGDCTQ